MTDDMLVPVDEDADVGSVLWCVCWRGIVGCKRCSREARRQHIHGNSITNTTGHHSKAVSTAAAQDNYVMMTWVAGLSALALAQNRRNQRYKYETYFQELKIQPS